MRATTLSWSGVNSRASTRLGASVPTGLRISKSLLIADVLNARCYLQGDGFQRRIEGTVDTPEFKATSVSMHSLDQSSRVLKRRRRVIGNKS